MAVIVASLWPLDSAAETVRVEDVENPALQAGKCNREPARISSCNSKVIEDPL